MVLEDLNKSIKDMTDEELRSHINNLKRLRIQPERTISTKPTKERKVKTNVDNQLADLISKLKPEQIKKLMEGLKNV